MPPEAPERYEALLRTMTRLVRDPEAPAGLAADAAGFLAAGGLGPDDAAQLAAFGAHRLQIYRRHIGRMMERAVRQEIPRTAARLGPAFATWVGRWLAEEAPRSPYFRDLAFELVAWAAPRWAVDAGHDGMPSYLGDLARHELAYFEVAASPEGEDAAPPAEIDLERRVRFSASTRICRYDHAVHRLDAALDARDVPERAPTALLAYRDEDHDVRFLELTPLAAAILERLSRGEPLGQGVRGACDALGATVDAAVIQSTAALLEDLIARRAILGGEA
jgi:hypothetical protein